jgi:hypothetical protein
MAGEALRAITVLAGSVISLALVSVILSNNSNSIGVIEAASEGFTSVLEAAEAPVSGGGVAGAVNFGGGIVSPYSLGTIGGALAGIGIAGSGIASLANAFNNKGGYGGNYTGGSATSSGGYTGGGGFVDSGTFD